MLTRDDYHRLLIENAREIDKARRNRWHEWEWSYLNRAEWLRSKLREIEQGKRKAGG